MDSPIRKMIDSSLIKNPISILNEFSLKTNSKFVFEFKSGEDGFSAEVIYKNQIIGRGKDKKKQAAKAKAAEEAVNFLSGGKKKRKSEEIPAEVLKTQKAKLKVQKKNPEIYCEYFIEDQVAAKAQALSEQQAKQLTSKTMNRLRGKPESSENDEVIKKAKIENIEEAKAVVKTPAKIPDSKADLFIEEMLKNFQLTDQEKSEVSLIEQEVALIQKDLNVSLELIGSHSFGALRRTKLEIDYCVITEKIDLKKILSFYESLEKARLVYLRVKESQEPLNYLSLSYMPKLVNSDQPWPYIKLLKDEYSFNIFFLESADYPRLQILAQKKQESCLNKNISILLRHWRQAKSLELPIELLDILIKDLVKESYSLSTALRVVLECLSGGVLLKGSTNSIPDKNFSIFKDKSEPESICKASQESLAFLICLSEGDLGSYFNR